MSRTGVLERLEQPRSMPLAGRRYPPACNLCTHPTAAHRLQSRAAGGYVACTACPHGICEETR